MGVFRNERDAFQGFPDGGPSKRDVTFILPGPLYRTAALRGPFGPTFIAIALLFFAWTSILGNYYYGESNLMYMLPHKGAVTVYRVAVLGMLIFGATSSVPLVWELADFFNGIMALLNLVGLLFLSGVVVRAMQDYETKFRAGEANPGVDAETLAGFSRR